MISEALIRQNAIACEQARHPECRCHCGGAFHGSAHVASNGGGTEEWAREVARELSRDDELARATTVPKPSPQGELAL